ncbi:basic proline-rich protein-like isoform X2 [Parus major]|uniref:basic proline-rich protein-like isoform X2 n=1 Tax=Parus major TaxID=9157 RepID=UPI0014445DC0|nr:basic proline-rich protein-like isoform X2 [Parus major]
MAPAPRARTGPAAGGATLSFPGDPSSRPPRVLKWWVGRPPSLPFLLPLIPSPARPALPESACRPRPGLAGQPPLRPSRPGLRGDPAPGPRVSREYGNGDPGNTATPPPAAALTCAVLTSRGRGQRCPPRRPWAAASPPPCAGPQHREFECLNTCGTQHSVIRRGPVTCSKSLCKSEAESSCCSKWLPSPCYLSHPHAGTDNKFP